MRPRAVARSTKASRAVYRCPRLAYTTYRFYSAGDATDGGGDAATTTTGPSQQPTFIPPKFPTAGAHDDGLIKPSEYLKSIGGGGSGGDPNEPPGRSAGNAPLHRTRSELSVAVQHQQQHQQQPLAAISIHDLHSVQLKKTPGTVKIMNSNADRQSGKYRALVGPPTRQAERQLFPFVVNFDSDTF